MQLRVAEFYHVGAILLRTVLEGPKMCLVTLETFDIVCKIACVCSRKWVHKYPVIKSTKDLMKSTVL
jgi:hypothetical protein